MKTKSRTINIAALILASLTMARAQVYVPGSPQATVRGGASAAVDIVEGAGSGTSSGTVSVKYSTSLDTVRKHYVKINLASQNPNTNGPLWIRYDTIANSQRQRVRLWSLDQSYPAMASTITWNTAQANDTASPSGLQTSGANTATAYGSFLSSATANAVDATHQLHGPWGHMITGDGTACLVLTSIENIGDNGLRFAVNSVELGFEPITSGSPPFISPITNSLAANGALTVVQGAFSTATNYFTASDVETLAGNLNPTFTSSSDANFPSSSLVSEGTDTNRRVYVNAPPTAVPGVYNVVAEIVDEAGNRATRSFQVTVVQADTAPRIVVGSSTNWITPTNTLINTPLTIPFTVIDTESAKDLLTVGAEVAYYSAGVLASAIVNGAGPNTNLSVTVTPQPNVDGVGVVHLVCSDLGGNITTARFCIMVRSNASVVFVDHFDYQGSNTALTNDAPALWVRRNTSPQSVGLRSGTDPVSLNKIAWVRPTTSGDALGARFAEGAYGPGSGAVLYTRFNVGFAESVAGNVITNVDGNSPFFRLSEGATAATDYVNQIALEETSPTDFTVLLSDGAINFNAWGSSFPKPSGGSITSMTVITRYDAATAKSTLWINAASEADPGVAGGGGQAPTPVGYVGLWQERGNGDVYFDDLTVIVKFRPRITAISVPASASVNIDFSAGGTDVIGDFQVEYAATVTGPYSNVPATITSTGTGTFRANVTAPGSDGYYKVKRVPLTF